VGRKSSFIRRRNHVPFAATCLHTHSSPRNYLAGKGLLLRIGAVQVNSHVLIILMSHEVSKAPVPQVGFYKKRFGELHERSRPTRFVWAAKAESTSRTGTWNAIAAPSAVLQRKEATSTPQTGKIHRREKRDRSHLWHSQKSLPGGQCLGESCRDSRHMNRSLLPCQGNHEIPTGTSLSVFP